MVTAIPWLNSGTVASSESRMGKKGNRSWGNNNLAIFEGLEPRRLLSTVTVTPSNFLGAISSSHAGDTISFSAGTYNVASSTPLPGNRVYQGNGVATITGPDPDTTSFDVNTVSGVELTGFTFTGTGIQVENSQVNINNNTFENIPGTGIFADGIYNSQINNNTFGNVANTENATGIMAYTGDDNSFDYNTFNDVYEPIHAIGGQNGAVSDSNDFSYNTIAGASRNGIEIQYTMTNLTVTNNWIGDWNLQLPLDSNGLTSHMALSIATGPTNTTGFPDPGNNITIADNTLLLNGASGQTPSSALYALTAIEAMGQNISIYGNYASGCGLAIMNGTSGTGVTNESNNTWICVQAVDADNTPWSITPIYTSADNIIAWNSANAPASPAAPAQLPAAPVSPAAPAQVPAAATTATAPVAKTTSTKKPTVKKTQQKVTTAKKTTPPLTTYADKWL